MVLFIYYLRSALFFSLILLIKHRFAIKNSSGLTNRHDVSVLGHITLTNLCIYSIENIVFFFLFRQLQYQSKQPTAMNSQPLFHDKEQENEIRKNTIQMKIAATKKHKIRLIRHYGYGHHIPSKWIMYTWISLVFLFCWKIVFGFQWGGTFFSISLKRCQFRQLPRSVVRISHIITASFKTVSWTTTKTTNIAISLCIRVILLWFYLCVCVCVCLMSLVWACALHSNFCLSGSFIILWIVKHFSLYVSFVSRYIPATHI